MQLFVVFKGIGWIVIEMYFFFQYYIIVEILCNVSLDMDLFIVIGLGWYFFKYFGFVMVVIGLDCCFECI